MVSIIDYSSTSWFALQSLSLRLNMLLHLASRLVETRFDVLPRPILTGGVLTEAVEHDCGHATVGE
jgi:hypothetical protein